MGHPVCGGGEDASRRAALAEETAQQLRRLVGQNPLLHLHLVVELRVVEYGEHRTGSAGLGIECGKDQSVKPGMDHGAGTHGAGLQRHIESAAQEPVVANRRRSRAQDDDFSVGCGVQVAQHAILTAGHDCAFADDNRANRHFAGLCGEAGLGERGLHEIEIGHSLLALQKLL